VNGTLSCENENLIQNLLKTEIGFPGFVVADVGGQVRRLPVLFAPDRIGLILSLLDPLGRRLITIPLTSKEPQKLSRFCTDIGGFAMLTLDSLLPTVLLREVLIMVPPATGPTQLSRRVSRTALSLKLSSMTKLSAMSLATLTSTSTMDPSRHLFQQVHMSTFEETIHRL